MKKYELSTKGKIVLAVITVVIIGIFIFLMTRPKSDIKLFVEVIYNETSSGKLIIEPQNNSEIKTEIGSTFDLKYSFSDKKDYGIKWIISDNSLAKIENDKLTIIAEGEVFIYAQSVKDPNIKSNEIKIIVGEEEMIDEGDSK